MNIGSDWHQVVVSVAGTVLSNVNRVAGAGWLAARSGIVVLASVT